MKTMWMIEINAPRATVWRALTAPGEVQPFYFGSRFEADLRPGGELRYTTPDGRRTFIRGTVLEAIPNVRLVHTFRFTDLTEPEQRVSFDLDDIATGTRVTVRHDGLTDTPRHRKRVTSGWTRILRNLKFWLEHRSLPWSSRVQNGIMKILAPLMPGEKRSHP